LHGLFVLYFFYIAVTHVADGTGEKTTRTTRRIEQDFPWLRVDTIHHEGGDGTGGIIFARIARALQVVEQLLVNVTEMLALA